MTKKEEIEKAMADLHKRLDENEMERCGLEERLDELNEALRKASVSTKLIEKLDELFSKERNKNCNILVTSIMNGCYDGGYDNDFHNMVLGMEPFVEKLTEDNTRCYGLVSVKYRRGDENHKIIKELEELGLGECVSEASEVFAESGMKEDFRGIVGVTPDHDIVCFAGNRYGCAWDDNGVEPIGNLEVMDIK